MKFGKRTLSHMPFQAAKSTTSSNAPGTTTAYDALGRPILVTDGGGETVQYTYNNNDVLQAVGPAPAGENTKQKQFEYDGLGRLTSVCEVTAGTTAWLGGTCAQTNPLIGYWTTYTYDALGHVLTVAQDAQATANQQTRSFTYDMLGRMLTESIPEIGNNGPNGTTTYLLTLHPRNAVVALLREISLNG